MSILPKGWNGKITRRNNRLKEKLRDCTGFLGMRGPTTLSRPERPNPGLLYFCNLNKPGAGHKFDLNKAIPKRGTIPTPGAASQGCLCKYPPAWVSTLRR
jgi:hypothetical protein